MNLTFLAPLFLLGAAAIAVPVIVHLVNRERRNSVAFPSLMFLRRVPFKSVRRQRIRHRALFALRCLALALLALAFARPFVDRESRNAERQRTRDRASSSYCSTVLIAWHTAIAGRARLLRRSARSPASGLQIARRLYSSITRRSRVQGRRVTSLWFALH